MKRTSWFLPSLFVLLVPALLPATAAAAVPDFVTYSGRLTDGTAWGQSTTSALTFRIYGQADGGTALWEQSFPSVAIEDGYFSVMLGTGTNPADGKALNVSGVFGVHDQTWITVCVGAGCTPELDMKPRQQIGSVPYAMKAADAGAVTGRPGDAIADMEAAKYYAQGAAALSFCLVKGDGNYTTDAVALMEGESGTAACTRFPNFGGCSGVFAFWIKAESPMPGVWAEANGPISCDEEGLWDPKAPGKVWACCIR